MTDADPRPEQAVSAPGAPYVTGAPTSPGPAGVDPLTAPLTYPGTPPRRPAVVVTDHAVLVFEPQEDAPLGEWLLYPDPKVPSAPARPADVVPTPVTNPTVTSADASHGSSHHPDPGHPEARHTELGHPGPGYSEPGQPKPGHSGPSHSERDHPGPGHPEAGHGEPPHTKPGLTKLGNRDPGHPGPGHSEPGLLDPGHPVVRHPDLVRPEPRHRDVSAADSESGPGLLEVPLDRYLRAAGGSPAASLTPVLAVGSNASPARLRRKLIGAGLPTLVPITAVSVRGLAVGVSAHVSRPGYLPATPIPSAAAGSELWVLWLDEAALAAIDATEPNYERVLLPDRCPVCLTTGQPVTGCWVYLSRHGYLLNQAGEPRRLTDQPTLISALLAEIPVLSPLAGTTPREWIERTRDAAVRDAIREAFGSAGLVRRVKEL